MIDEPFFQVKALIEADMKSLDVATADGTTALHVAAKRGNAEAVKLLIKRQANANCKRWGESKVVNLCSGKPGLPVKIVLPLVPVKKTFTGKKI